MQRIPAHTYPRRPAPLSWLATAAPEVSSSTAPPPPLPTDPKLNQLVDSISGLTLLQAADLVTLLKVRMALHHTLRVFTCVILSQTRLNIQEIAIPAAGPTVAAPAAEAEAAVEVRVFFDQTTRRLTCLHVFSGEAQGKDNLQREA